MERARSIDVSWRTLKLQLKGYCAADRSLAVDVTERMAELERDMSEKIHYVWSPMDLKLWLLRMMHNSLQVHGCFASVAKRQRTFLYDTREVDIQDVVGVIADKIQELYEIRDTIDLPRLKRELDEEGTLSSLLTQLQALNSSDLRLSPATPEQIQYRAEREQWDRVKNLISNIGLTPIPPLHTGLPY